MSAGVPSVWTSANTRSLTKRLAKWSRPTSTEGESGVTPKNSRLHECMRHCTGVALRR